MAARVALRDYSDINRVLVIDCDVHQGNGTAVIFQVSFELTLRCHPFGRCCSVEAAPNSEFLFGVASSREASPS